MEQNRAVMVRIGELWLKSEPVKKQFMLALTRNIKAAMETQEIEYSLEEYRGRILIFGDPEKIAPIAARIFGIVDVSICETTTNLPEDMAKTALKFAEKKLKPGMRFAVRARRQHVSGFTSQQLAGMIADVIWEKIPDFVVDLDNPEYEVFVEAREYGGIVYDERIPGQGGLPLGTAGRAAALLSSGIDSPVAAWLKYEATLQEISGARELLDDPAMEDMAQEELTRLLMKKEKEETELKGYLIVQDPNDKRNVIMEIRPGTGGDEAGLFGALLLRMYTRYAERRGFKVQYTSITDSEVGGIKEAVFMLQGVGAFSRMKFESGVHRVQRVPATESQGRIHTSTATVAVLPEIDDIDDVIDLNDLRIDVYRSSGHGGQCVNTTDSAVRITHLPSGLVVTCQNEKSQLKNREAAMKVLKSRLHEMRRAERDAAYAGERKGQLGTGDRSERIRTYNFPQGRVTDHRINLTLYKIDAIMDGELDEIIDALTIALREQEGKE